MPSEDEERQFIQATNDVEEFTKLFAKKYPLLFKKGYCGMKVHPSPQHPLFPYTVTLEIKEEK
jgi:hypothetical protein